MRNGQGLAFYEMTEKEEAMNRFAALLLLLTALSVIPAGSAGSEEADSTTAGVIRKLEAEIDALREEINSMEGYGRGGRHSRRRRTPAGTDSWISLLEEKVKGVTRADMNRRSRRKRVNALLEAITEMPGQLRFSGGSTAIIQYGYSESNDHTAGTGSFDIYAHTAFGPRSLLFFDLEAVGGNGPGEYFPTMTGLNDDAGSTQDQDGLDRLNVLEAWSEFTLLDRRCTITAGKIDLTNYFDHNASANDETTQFISSAFVNSAAFAVPDNSPGIRFRTTLADRFHFQLGLSSVDNSGKDLFKDIYRIGSLGFTFFPDSDFESNFRFYGYQHPSAEDSFGYGISLDHVSFGAFNLFARYGLNQDELADLWKIESAWSAGARMVHQVAGKTAVLGIAAGESSPASSVLERERMMEIYTRWSLNEWTSISPHFQLVWNADGTSERITLFGIRTNYSF
ncbi:MAG: hypothetical protein GF417_13105 [Candidatus Latescibacteria bacterium]|nr:hypothetical protein [bacterium]MBD3425365.1 hypothetical protein [Candidatus Latescibacterota bacterium]